MPQALSVVWDVIRYEKKSPKIAELLKSFDEVLGLNIDKKEDVDIPDEIVNILEERKEARVNKDYAKSDELRDKLKELGYIVKDTKDGQKIEKV